MALFLVPPLIAFVDSVKLVKVLLAVTAGGSLLSALVAGAAPWAYLVAALSSAVPFLLLRLMSAWFEGTAAAAMPQVARRGRRPSVPACSATRARTHRSPRRGLGRGLRCRGRPPGVLRG